MSKTPAIIMLPGMDGTGSLFQPVMNALPKNLVAHVISYPGDLSLGYNDLQRLVERKLPKGKPFVLLGESFSGPLALKIAARTPKGLRAVILVSSLVRLPVRLPFWLARIVAWVVLLLGVPEFAVRWFLLGRAASPELVGKVLAAINSVRPSVLSRRLVEVLSQDTTEELKACLVLLAHLYGRQDRLVPRKCLRQISAIRPDARAIEIDGPHLLLQARPAEAAKEIGKVLARIKRHDGNAGRPLPRPLP